MPDDLFTVLFLGDVVGKPGRAAASRFLKEYRADFKIINGENTAGGLGITPALAMEMLEAGADAITTGNHVWKKREIIPYLMAEQRVIRPLNYPQGTPGFGATLVQKGDKAVRIANIEGRTFMNTLDCPFRAMEEFLVAESDEVPIIVDFHAEATSEKVAMGWFLDGRVACVVGTHTHVQTSDETILPKGTGYITDLGMTGPVNSVIGMDKVAVIERFVTQLPQKYEVAKGDIEVQGAVITINNRTRHCLKIERIREKVG
ncbi:MAG: TIGR00282 family metallophosphoesterase [Syntrophorhabdales bacterium]|jgi:metallophosphoesterase (TIGR00282 family)